MEVAEETVPKRKSRKKPWLTEKVFKLADERREVKGKGLEKEDARREYRDLNRQIQQQIRKDKSDFMNQKCAEIERDGMINNTKEVFKNVKLLTSKPNTRLNVLKDGDGTILTEEKDIKDRWQQYCERLYASQEEVTDQENDHQLEYEEDPDILLSEVEQAIKRMRSGKSPGFDNIQAELLKESGTEGVEVIYRLCCKIWKIKEWPEDWKKAVFLPLPKKGDTRECGNNCTISLISHASKVMLHIIAERIRLKLESESPQEQAGLSERERNTQSDWKSAKFDRKISGVSPTFVPLFHRLFKGI